MRHSYTFSNSLAASLISISSQAPWQGPFHTSRNHICGHQFDSHICNLNPFPLRQFTVKTEYLKISYKPFLGLLRVEYTSSSAFCFLTSYFITSLLKYKFHGHKGHTSHI